MQIKKRRIEIIMCSYNECQVLPPPCTDITLMDDNSMMISLCSSSSSTTNSSSSNSDDSNDPPRCDDDLRSSEQQQPNNNTNNNRSGRRVRFNEGVAVRWLPRAQDLVDSIDELWYQKEDRRKTIRRVSAIVRAFESGDYYPKEGRKLCIRGLEMYMESGKDIALARRAEALTVVLDAQSVLNQYGITSSCCTIATTTTSTQEHDVAAEQQNYQYYCSDLLANIYKDTTEESKLEAYQRGVSDAIEIQRMYHMEFNHNEIKTVKAARAG